MKTRSPLLLFALAIALVVILLFLLAEALGFPLLTDPEPWLPQHGPGAAVLSISLLGLDVFLPVPSSILMTLNGKLFGFLTGILVSMAGCSLSGLIAYGIGRGSGPLLRRLCSEQELAGAREGLQRWGLAAVVFSRPIPVLAETTAVAAAAGGMNKGLYAAGILIGSLPLSLIYALAGSLAQDLQSGLWIMAAVLMLSGVCWGYGRRKGKS